MGTGSGPSFGLTKGAKSELHLSIIKNSQSTAEVWKHVTPTQENYKDTVIPKSFTIDTPQGTMWTHGNATEHMFEAATTLKTTAPKIITTNPNLYSQFLLYDYWKSLCKAVKNGINYDKLIQIGHWEFKFSPPRNSALSPVIKHAQFNGFK